MRRVKQQPADTAISRATAVDTLWRHGCLKYKLWEQQQHIYVTIRAMERTVQTVVVLCARQYGKSVLGCLLALEDCLRNPNVVVLIVGPTIKQARAIVRPRIKLLMQDCPVDLVRPVKSEDTWYFSNGSELKLGGFDTNSSAERGKTLYKVYIEEIVDSDADSFLDFLRSDLSPALTHSKHAQIVYLTTMPKIPDHPFVLEIIPDAVVNGAFFKYTIHDNKKINQDQYDSIVRLMGGEHTDDFRREYLCEIVRDSSIILAPEFDEALHVRHCARLDFSSYWVCGDTGGIRDKSVFHLCDYDFKRAKVRFLDERAFDPETSSSVMVQAVFDMEREYHVTSRHVDAPGQLQIDLMAQHNFPCSLPRKDELEATVNQVRVALRSNEIEIDPKCKLLILTLRSGTFNKLRTDLARTSALGHMDAFMSCAYGYRHANRSNPFPLYGAGVNAYTHYIDPANPQRSRSAQTIQSLFSVKDI